MDRKLKVFFFLGPCFPVNPRSSLTPGSLENVGVRLVLHPLAGEPQHTASQYCHQQQYARLSWRICSSPEQKEGEAGSSLPLYIGEKETYIRSDAQEVSLPQGTRGHSMRSTDSSGICSSDIYLTLCAWTVLDTDFVRLEQEQPIKGEKLKLQERVKEGRATVTSFSELKLGV